MRTKHFLAALCLPMAFAACSNEEFMDQTPSSSLEARGTVNVTLNAEKAPIFTADTRMSIDENYKFVWEKGTDKIGAALVDGGTEGTIATNSPVLANYPFIAQDNGLASKFNAVSSITQGSYLFYYGYTDVIDREALDLNVPEQVYKVGSEKSAIQQAANYMKMISPIVTLEDGVKLEDAQGYNLNLKFVNLYSIVKVDIASKNITSGVTPKLEKVTLNAVDGNVTGFVKTAKADLQIIAGNATVNSGANVLTPGTDGKLDPTEMDEALEAINTLLIDANNDAAATIYQSSGATYGAAEVSVDGDLALSAAEKTSLYILVPKGTYDEHLTLEVVTSEGTYTKTITHTSEKPLILGDKVQVIEADLDFRQDGNGNVILPTTIPVKTSEDWTKAVEFVTAHSVAYIDETITFELEDDIEIASLPIFKLGISGDYTITLTEDYAVTAQNAAQFTVSDTKLAVKKGATLTLATTATQFAEFVNYGTLNVEANQTIAITNLGTMNVTKDVDLSGGLVNGQEEDKGNKLEEIAGTINVAAEKTLKISSKILENLVGDINVNGTLDINFANSTNAGTITIAKKGIVTPTNDITLTNTGTISNFGKLAMKVSNENGKIIAQDGGISAAGFTISKGIVEVMNVTTFATTQGGAGKYIFDSTTGSEPIVTTEVTNKKQYAAADDSSVGITNITLAGGDWTLASAAGTDETKTIAAPSNATGLTLKNVTLTMAATLGDKAIIAEGTSTIKAATAQTITEAALTVNEGATLNVENNITVNTNGTGNDLVANILGTLNVKTGAKMYFNNVTVGTADKTAAAVNVSGDTEAIDAEAVFGVKTTFTNYGMVKSESGKTDAGKVTQPVNTGDAATFKGNASTITFS